MTSTKICGVDVATGLIFFGVMLTLYLVDGGCVGHVQLDKEHCELEGHTIPVSSSKEIGCMDCFCDKDKVGRGLILRCCDAYPTPTVPSYCKVVKDGCFPIAVMRNNPSEPCDRILGHTGG